LAVAYADEWAGSGWGRLSGAGGGNTYGGGAKFKSLWKLIHEMSL